MTANTCMSPNLPGQEAIRTPQNSKVTVITAAKKGHKKADCHKKKRDDKAKLKKADATHATGDDNKEQYEAKYPETGTVTLDGITYVARDVKPQRTIEQGPDVTLNMQEQVVVIGHGGGHCERQQDPQGPGRC